MAERKIEEFINHQNLYLFAYLISKLIKHTLKDVLSKLTSRHEHSGKSPFNPLELAAQTPRSVIRPVIKRLGVTSNAKFATALPSGVI